MTTALHWSADHVGLPWGEPGEPGVRCWTLIGACFWERHGIAIPTYDGPQASAGELDELSILMTGRGAWPWQPIARRGEPDFEERLADAREFDVVVFRGRPLHAGLVLSPGEMLHIERRQGQSCVTRYDTGRWKPALLGLYRHVALIQ